MNDSEILHIFRQLGTLPHGEIGRLALIKPLRSARYLAEELNKIGISRCRPQEIDIQFSGLRIQGRLQSVLEWPDGTSGLVHYHSASLKGKQVAKFYLDRLIGCAAGVVTGKNLLYQVVETKDSSDVKAIEGPAIDPDKALETLEHWGSGWRRGQVSAVAYFPNTSCALSERFTGLSIKNPNAAWNGAPYNNIPGEGDKEAVKLLYPDSESVLESLTVKRLAISLFPEAIA